ncbi:cytochrome P450, partial [Mycena sanguinolenta]
VGPLMSSKKEAVRRTLEFLGPVIWERLAKEEELGPDWADKPNDLISWVIQNAARVDRTVAGIAHRVLIVNMAAIHTSTLLLPDTCRCTFDLTMYPSHIEPIREEVERVIMQEGWSKGALNSMHLVDGFILAKDGFKFSDGTTIPFGSFLATSGRAVQHDPENYDRPEIFDGFRFAGMREELKQTPITLFSRTT